MWVGRSRGQGLDLRKEMINSWLALKHCWKKARTFSMPSIQEGHTALDKSSFSEILKKREIVLIVWQYFTNRVINYGLNCLLLWRQISVKVLHSVGTLMEHIFEGSAPLRLWYVNSEEKICMVLLFSFGLMYQCLNRAIPSRKCSNKAPSKWRKSVYVLTEICHQRSKWLSPI